jgi:hypothetical protein
MFGDMKCATVLGVALALWAAVSHAQAPSAPDKKTPAPAAVDRSPMMFYLAKGELGACGHECAEWIAAEGYIDAGAADRLGRLLKQLGSRSVPIFFQSPGGLVRGGMALGRLLRTQGMTAAVAKTVPDACGTGTDESCRKLKRSGSALVAKLRSSGAFCNSACVYALIGARVRQVAPDVSVGVHSSRVVYPGPGRKPPPSVEKARLASFNGELRGYIRQMGIDSGFFDAVMKVSPDSIQYLSRGEVARFGIDTRRLVETPWTYVDALMRPAGVIKFISEAKGAERAGFRTSFIRLECESTARVRIIYARALASDEVHQGAGPWPQAAINLVAGARRLDFVAAAGVPNVDLLGSASDTWIGHTQIDFFETVPRVSSIELVENGGPSVLRLSAAGLIEAVTALRRACGTLQSDWRRPPSAQLVAWDVRQAESP